MGKKVDVKYNVEYLKLLKLLSNINEKFLVKKTEDKKHIEVESKNAATTVAYTLKAKVENFNFSGDEVAFYKYPEFMELFNAFEKPALSQDGTKFEINKDKSKIKYNTAEPDSVPDVFKKIEFKDPDLEFKLTDEEFVNIRKMIGLLDSETVEFSVENNVLTIALAGEEEDSSYEKQYDIEETDDISVIIPKDIFNLAPKGEYTVQVKEEGIIRFVYNNGDGFELDLYTAENEED